MKVVRVPIQFGFFGVIFERLRDFVASAPLWSE